MLSEKLCSSFNPLILQATRTLIAKRAAGEAADPVLLARRAGIEPDAWQAEALRSPSRQMILLCSRQSGKSTVTAIAALHEALYNEGALVLILAPAQRQSQELFIKLKRILNSLPSLPTQIAEESALRLEFANGSRIVALPGKEATIRSFSNVALIVCDEASRIPDSLFFSVRPMLAVSKGRIVLLSTPFGKRGHFYDAWENGGAEWERIKITARECPRIDPVWLANERKSIGAWWAAQEYDCIFVDALDSVFNSADIEAALSSDVKSLDWW